MKLWRTAQENLRRTAADIRTEVERRRVTYRDEGSLAWAVDDVKVAWADLLDALAAGRLV